MGLDRANDLARVRSKNTSVLDEETAPYLETERPSAQTQAQEEHLIPMEEYLGIVETLKERVAGLEESSNQIRRYQTKILTSVNYSDTSIYSEALGHLTAETTRSIEEINKKIDYLGHQIRLATTDKNFRKRSRDCLAGLFKRQIKAIQALHLDYQEKCKKNLERQYQIVNPAATQREIEAACSYSDPAAFHSQQKRLFLVAEEADQRTKIDELQERYYEISLLEKKIIEIHSILQNIERLIGAQGDLVHRIQESVEQTDERVEKAVESIDQGIRQKRACQRRKWLLGLLFVFLVAGIILYVVEISKKVAQ